MAHTQELSDATNKGDLPLDPEIDLPPKEFKRKIKKGNVIYFSIVHICGVYGLYCLFTGSAKWETIVLTIFLYYVSVVGVTAGSHRLWSHRAYKAKLPLQVLLTIMHTIAFQFSAITWVRDHRAHHKYTDTDGDPQNSKRGLFFSHIGWVMLQKHPDVKKGGQKIDLSDAYQNRVIRFQHRYYNLLAGFGCFILPTLIPLLWGEALSTAWHLNQTRYMMSLHGLFLIHSAAHKWGNKPYDKSIAPSQNIGVSITSLGEGFHNYHHTFPFDYRASEIGNDILNPTTYFIDFFARIGWAYDLRTPTPEMVRDRSKRTGDGSHHSVNKADKILPGRRDTTAATKRRDYN